MKKESNQIKKLLAHRKRVRKTRVLMERFLSAPTARERFATARKLNKLKKED